MRADSFETGAAGLYLKKMSNVKDYPPFYDYFSRLYYIITFVRYNAVIGGNVMANREKSELKKRALLAKQRMKMGYWQRMHEERRELMQQSNDSSRLQLLSSLQRSDYVRTTSMALNRDKADKEEQLYRKVCSILASDENVTNPIGQLVERDLYDTMDEQNKQRYILELSQKFRELKDRYYRESRKFGDA